MLAFFGVQWKLNSFAVTVEFSHSFGVGIHSFGACDKFLLFVGAQPIQATGKRGKQDQQIGTIIIIVVLPPYCSNHTNQLSGTSCSVGARRRRCAAHAEAAPCGNCRWCVHHWAVTPGADHALHRQLLSCRSDPGVY